MPVLDRLVQLEAAALAVQELPPLRYVHGGIDCGEVVVEFEFPHNHALEVIRPALAASARQQGWTLTTKKSRPAAQGGPITRVTLHCQAAGR